MSPPFDANETSYKIDASEDVKDLNIFAVPENENAKVEIKGEKGLKEGENIVTILVTAENGYTTKKYTVEVYKRNKEEQIVYEEEQNKHVEKLQEAYKIEKADSKSEDIKAENKNYTNIILISIIVSVLLIICGIVYFIRKIIKK